MQRLHFGVRFIGNDDPDGNEILVFLAYGLLAIQMILIRQCLMKVHSTNYCKLKMLGDGCITARGMLPVKRMPEMKVFCLIQSVREAFFIKIVQY